MYSDGLLDSSPGHLVHLWPVSSRCSPTAVLGCRPAVCSLYLVPRLVLVSPMYILSQLSHFSWYNNSYNPLTKAERFCRKFGNFFHHKFDSVYRMPHQKLCFQSPKIFTPKKGINMIKILHKLKIKHTLIQFTPPKYFFFNFLLPTKLTLM